MFYHNASIKIGTWTLTAVEDNDNHLTLYVSRDDDPSDIIEVEAPDDTDHTIRLSTKGIELGVY
jgi:hypothetical protein|tara:strand:- start:626 stop:817 length:192 start_codon:yes stop_codon:yes gene_type:complete